MVLKRVIPTLLLRNTSLVKTVNFKQFNYIGDPANTVRIFNELEVDELCFLDITATIENRGPNYKVLSEIANECFMPLSYGGGIKNMDQAQKVLGMGFEKVIVNSAAFNDPELIPQIASKYGNQSVVGSLDVKKVFLGGEKVISNSGSKNTGKNPVEWAKELERMGVGEIIITSIDKEGTWDGYDVNLVKSICEAVNVPVIAKGGCGSVEDFKEVFALGGVQAAAVGSMVVFQKKGMGVLVNYPQNEVELIKKLM